MTMPRTLQRLAMLLLACGIASPALAQDPLARAKNLYASAAYDDALAVLATLHPTDTPVASEAAAYQVFCLLALGRTEEATDAVKALVAADPLYHPSEAEASPRVRTFFDDTRGPMLPDLVRQSYATAKAAFDVKDLETARAGFDRVLALVDDMGESADQAMADLRTLAGGFRDLSLAMPSPASSIALSPLAASTPPTVEPVVSATADDVAVASPAAVTPAPVAASEPTIYGPDDKDVRKPAAISQAMPEWRPRNPLEESREYNGTIDLIIGEDGTVLSAVVTTSVHPRYDPELVKAALSWQFRPATRGGVPVQYRYRLKVHLSARVGGLSPEQFEAAHGPRRQGLH
jgi:tetratricopeptide (TPR) repeat protein